MKAVFSSTYDPLYQFFIPIAAYSWKKLGVESICFMPQEGIDVKEGKRLYTVLEACDNAGLDMQGYTFRAPKDKQATYAQLSRLFAATLPFILKDETIITSDVDMAVFSNELTNGVTGSINVWGKDLVPENQLAMCYVRMPKSRWLEVFDCGDSSYQQMLDRHLSHIECEHFRGNYWGYDQGALYTFVHKHARIEHKRAHPGTQFASRRCDRDDGNWRSTIGPDLFDAHLWRPGYTDENFEKILTLFSTMYPEDDLTWMHEYRNKFIQLL